MKLKKLLSVLMSFALLMILIPDISVKTSAAYENTHTNTGNQREDIVAVAETQIGYHEGANNDTKYNRWNGRISSYPVDGYGYPWCQCFISWCADQAEIQRNIIPKTAGTSTAQSFFINEGVYYESASNGGDYVPRRGDIVFYGSGTSPAHVGIITDCDGDSISTIEGNYSDGVGTRTISLYDSYVIGFAVPNYKNDFRELPEKPNPIISRTIFSVDETVNITWDSTAYTDLYWLHIYRNGEDYVNESIGKDLSYSATYPVGEYTAFIVACNDYGETVSSVDFTVADDVPPAPQPKISKTIFSKEEEVVVTWDATPNTTHYWLHTYKDGEDFENKDMYDNLFYSRTYPAGKYTLFIASYNNNGYNAECVEFTVYDTKPESPYPQIERKYFSANEEINVTWNPTKNTTHYWLHTYKDDEDFENKDMYNNLSYSRKYPAGNYTLYIASYNDYGYNAECVEFTVYDSKPEWTKVDINKSEVKINEEVTFTLTSDTGHAYTVGIDDENGKRLITYDTDVTQDVTTQCYTHIFDKAGKYSCYITAYNNYGLADSERIYFTVIGNDGDVNTDGNVTTADIVLLKKSLMNKQSLTKTQFQTADLNQDGNVNIYDFILLKRMLIYGK